MKTPDVARGALEAVAAVSDECVASHIADGGYSWTETAPAPASISSPDSRPYAGTRVAGEAVSGRCFAFWNAVLSAEAKGTCH